ncbi:unnamed protein product [Diplocarpon coronariae]|uniref:Myb-like DNA-binding domain-containing protein n=1 Tax=Diplocarpon coronariae TaxID=2795749 RepID=A0A218Z4N3_9HELO|nr:hypothetical protein B2J93_5612 [Marssonina coronariae]
MPSKIQLDENLWFLYICLQKSDLKAIDFNAVGLATSLKPPAARMRYTRLKRQIESGSLSTHAATASPPSPTILPSLSPASRSTSTSTFPLSVPNRNTQLSPSNKIKRKRGHAQKSQIPEGGSSSDGGDEQEPQPSIPASKAGRLEKKDKKSTLGLKEEKDKIKIEGWSSDSSSLSDGDVDEDSEDEIPLAKLRKMREMQVDMTGKQRSGAPSPSPSACGVGVGVPGYNTYAMTPRPHYAELIATPRCLPQSQGFADGLSSLDGMGYTGRGIYVSPYVGWIDGHGNADQMGRPAGVFEPCDGLPMFRQELEGGGLVGRWDGLPLSQEKNTGHAQSGENQAVESRGVENLVR